MESRASSVTTRSQHRRPCMSLARSSPGTTKMPLGNKNRRRLASSSSLICKKFNKPSLNSSNNSKSIMYSRQIPMASLSIRQIRTNCNSRMNKRKTCSLPLTLRRSHLSILGSKNRPRPARRPLRIQPKCSSSSSKPNRDLNRPNLPVRTPSRLRTRI